MFGMNNGYDVFLGGTCNGSTWRDTFITKMKETNKSIKCYNPVVDAWTQECIYLENFIKLNAPYHVYVITPRISGVYSIAEMVESAMTKYIKTFFCILDTDNDLSYHFDASMINSLTAVSNLLVYHHATKTNSIDELVKKISDDYNSTPKTKSIWY